MQFIKTPIEGAVLIDIEPVHDQRGFFARTHALDEFLAHGIDARVVQSSIAWNERRGTLRGLHFQLAPHRERKIVRCLRGTLYAVAVDLRPDSRSFLQHVGVNLTQHNHRALYIPDGCASGYQTLTDDTEIMYDISVAYAPDHQGGVHHADPILGVTWPLRVSTISKRDAALPTFGLPARPRPALRLGGAG